MYSIVSTILRRYHYLCPSKSFRYLSNTNIEASISRNLSSLIEPVLKPLSDHQDQSTKLTYLPISYDDDISQLFFEQYVSNELMLNENYVKKIYFLYNDKIKKYYPNNEAIIHLCKFLKIFFTVDDLNNNPSPFSLPFQYLYNRYFFLLILKFYFNFIFFNFRICILKEIGFRSFNVSLIDSTDDILNLNLIELRKYLNYPQEQNCFETMCKILDIFGDAKSNLLEYIQNNYDNLERISIKELRILCISKYLSVNFNLPFNRYLFLCQKYLNLLNEINLAKIKMNVEYLKNDFNYTQNKILNNGLFLAVTPDNLSLILTKLRNIVGENMYQNLISVPNVLIIDFAQIVKNYELIKQKCNGTFFNRSIQLLSIEPKRLELLFNKMETNEDICNNKLTVLGLDYLVIYRQRILERIDALKHKDIPINNIPLSFFYSNDYEFEKLINDLASDPQIRVRFYLESRFNLDYEKFKNKYVLNLID